MAGLLRSLRNVMFGEDPEELDEEALRKSGEAYRIMVEAYHKEIEEKMYSKAYYKALEEGEARNTRIPIIIVGSDRVGKSSLRKHLLGLPFHIEEPSTNGIEVDVVELTAENAKDPWRTIGGKFFTSAEEAEEEAFKNTAKLLSEAKQENDIEIISQDYRDLEYEKIEKIQTLELNDICGEQSAPIKVFVHDFAGQSIFYDTHFCFLKMLCPYVLVVDASVDLDEPSQPRFKFKSVDVERKLNDPILETNLDRLLSWLTVLERLSDSFNEILEREDLEYKLPPVVIVLTNIDRCKGNFDEVVKRIKELISRKAFQNVLPDIFLIDNTSLERNGTEIKKLRELVYELCTSILKKQPLMPVRWLQFEGVLSNMMLNEGKMHISIEDARAAAKSCNIDDADAALKFLHHQAVIVHHSQSPVVVLDPPWLMNLFTEIITVPPKKIPKDAPLYDLLMSKGILMQDYIQRKVGGKLLENLMKQFSLICPWEYEEKCAYIVPSVAPLMDEGEGIQERLSTSPISPGFIHFNWSYVPLGYYTKFQIQMINHCREDLLRTPEIYCNYTLLSFRRPEGEFDVYLIKIPGKIKVGIVPREDPDPEVCNIFVNFLRLALEYCVQKVKDEEPLIYRNVTASLMVKCSACSWRTETCLQHLGNVKCDRDECCHFWPVEDLQKCNKDPVCHKNNLTTIKFSLDSVKFWLHKEGNVSSEKQSNSDNKSNNREENDDALPSDQVLGNSSGKDDAVLPSDQVQGNSDANSDLFRKDGAILPSGQAPARSSGADDNYLGSVCKCTDVFARHLKNKSEREFNSNPLVFPVVVDRKIIGTAFVFQTKDSRSYVVSWSFEEESTCRMIVNIMVNSITLRHKHHAGATVAEVSSQNLAIGIVPEQHSGNVSPLKAVPSDGDQTGSKFYMASRRAVHGCGNRLMGLLPKRTSKICQVKRREDGSYVRRRGRSFKSFPRGAPLVNDKEELVGVITAFEKEVVTGILSVTELENILKD